jgi:hypothetical protein
MDLEALIKAVAATAISIVTLVSVGSRRKRLRNEIRENLALVKELEKDEVLHSHSHTVAWLQGRIAVDVARLSRQPLGTPKKPIPWGSVGIAAVLALASGAWTWYLTHDELVWYAVFPALIAFLLGMSVVGMTTNREIPPDPELPPGASPLRTQNEAEQIATAVVLAATGGEPDDRFDDDKQVGVAYRFATAMSEYRYADGLALAERNWLLCRIQSWIWNNRAEFGDDFGSLDALAASLVDAREPADVWSDFVEIESREFSETWAHFDRDKYGAGSRRRQIAEEYDLVILAPLGDSQGYFVQSATVVQNAMVFVLHHDAGKWLIANHAGEAPPVPGWPPAWWIKSGGGDEDDD